VSACEGWVLHKSLPKTFGAVFYRPGSCRNPPPARVAENYDLETKPLGPHREIVKPHHLFSWFASGLIALDSAVLALGVVNPFRQVWFSGSRPGISLRCRWRFR